MLMRAYLPAASAQYLHNVIVMLEVLVLGYVSGDYQTGLFAFAFQVAAQALEAGGGRQRRLVEVGPAQIERRPATVERAVPEKHEPKRARRFAPFALFSHDLLQTIAIGRRRGIVAADDP
mgnify:CR=1 FL=1